MKNYILSGDFTQAVVVRVQADSKEEAVEKAERCELQIVDFCPDLYKSFEWDGDEEFVQELDIDDWNR